MRVFIFAVALAVSEGELVEDILVEVDMMVGMMVDMMEEGVEIMEAVEEAVEILEAVEEEVEVEMAEVVEGVEIKKVVATSNVKKKSNFVIVLLLYFCYESSHFTNKMISDFLGPQVLYNLFFGYQCIFSWEAWPKMLGKLLDQKISHQSHKSSNQRTVNDAGGGGGGF